MKRIYFLFIFMIVGISVIMAQMQQPIKWTVLVDMQTKTEGTITFCAKIEDGWHLYGLTMPENGPNATAILFDNNDGVKMIGGLTPSRAPIEKVDMIFQLKVSWWDADVSFSQRFKIGNDSIHMLSGTIAFQSCNDKSCIAPTKERFAVVVGTQALETEDEIQPVMLTSSSDSKNVAVHAKTWWEPVVFDVDDSVAGSTFSWWYIFIWGVVGGLLALLTPCVWPMIPLTVSFFLKRNTTKAHSVKDAAVYGLAIIIIYLVLGLAITQIYGAGKLNDIATNAVFNIIFFAILVIFAISFFGAFDIKLPSKWSNSIDGKAERTTGLVSIFFMAFTLVLVSFSCTGPIIGTLLVEAASMGNISGPAVGMCGFALALAIPFALFAIFPSWLKKMPRSGGWLNSVKVVLGFLELALSLKFLSVADLAYGWGILDREVFISLWIIIFMLLGFYLLGKIQFSHDSKIERITIPRFFLALFSMSFAVYLIPGLWGAPLKSVSAFVPPLYTQDFNLYTGGNFQEFDDYDEGMQYALDNNRPALIDFSGYGCVNCRKMEGAVFNTKNVENIIKENYVLIKLMVDDKTKLEKPYMVEENGKKVKIETVGEKWSYLQRHKFATNSQPYYVILDNGGNALVEPAYYDEDVAKFVEFLNKGVTNYAKAKN